MPEVNNIPHFFAIQDVHYLADRVTGGDPADVRSRAATCTEVGGVLDRASDDTDTAATTLFRSWTGEAADAARRALARAADQRREQGSQLRRSATAFDTVATALDVVQAEARECVAESDAASRALTAVLDEAQTMMSAASPVMGAASWITEKVTGVDVEASVASFLTSALTPIKDRAIGVLQRMNTALDVYEQVLREQSEVLRGMPGVVRADAGPVDLPGDADLRRGALFRAVYGRDPVSPQDLRMAQALDAQGSDSGNTQSNANVTVIRITPVPGSGVVHGSAFIAEDDVLNPMYLDSIRNHGDNRGFDPNAGPDKARMSFDIDYETGVVVVRQNASVTNAGESVTGYPDVGVEQDPSGRVRLRVEGTDPFADPFAGATGTSVRADFVVDPHGGGAPASVSGKVSQYPSWEVYQDQGGQTGRPMLQRTEPLGPGEAWVGDGPALNVGKPTVPVGPDEDALPDWREQYHPDQHGGSGFLAGVQNSLPPPFGSIGSKITDDFYDFPLHDQPYPTVDSSGRLDVPSADRVG